MRVAAIQEGLHIRYGWVAVTPEMIRTPAWALITRYMDLVVYHEEWDAALKVFKIYGTSLMFELVAQTDDAPQYEVTVLAPECHIEKVSVKKVVPVSKVGGSEEFRGYTGTIPYNKLDIHGDMHVPGCFSKSIKSKQ